MTKLFYTSELVSSEGVARDNRTRSFECGARLAQKKKGSTSQLVASDANRSELRLLLRSLLLLSFALLVLALVIVFLLALAVIVPFVVTAIVTATTVVGRRAARRIAGGV